MNTKDLTFDKLPEAVAYLTDQVIEMKMILSSLPKAQPEKKELIGIDEASQIIHKAKPTIYALVRKGVLPAYKQGKKLYFYEDELIEWVENGRRSTSPQSYEDMLNSIQSQVRHKPKSIKR